MAHSLESAQARFKRLTSAHTYTANEGCPTLTDSEENEIWDALAEVELEAALLKTMNTNKPIQLLFSNSNRNMSESKTSEQLLVDDSPPTPFLPPLPPPPPPPSQPPVPSKKTSSGVLSLDTRGKVTKARLRSNCKTVRFFSEGFMTRLASFKPDLIKVEMYSKGNSKACKIDYSHLGGEERKKFANELRELQDTDKSVKSVTFENNFAFFLAGLPSRDAF